MFNTRCFSRIAALLALLLAASSASAQTPVPTLPAPSEGTTAGLVIGSENASEYRPIIIPEFYPLVRARLLEMDSVSQLKIDLKEFLPKAAEGDAPEITPEGILPEGYRPKPGIPFPNWEEETDNSKRAMQVLWNVQALYWDYRIWSANFSLNFVEGGKQTKSLRGEWIRVYPALVSDQDKSIQLFRELIKFTFPKIISNLSFLTFRFLGKEEDMLWYSSAALKRVVELTGSNRSDPILDSSFSPEDLLGWSGKVEGAEAEIKKELTALVPAAALEARALSPAGKDCVQYRKPESGVPVANLKWNYNTHRYPDGFAWLPTDALFFPRKLLRIELIPRDPFALHGRQILYVDKELMIPYYRFVFNRAGYLWKTVFYVPGFFQTKDKSRSLIFNEYLLVEDRQYKTANTAEFESIRFCKSYDEELKLSNFDPQNLPGGQAAQPTPAPTSAKKR